MCPKYIVQNRCVLDWFVDLMYLPSTPKTDGVLLVDVLMLRRDSHRTFVELELLRDLEPKATRFGGRGRTEGVVLWRVGC